MNEDALDSGHRGRLNYVAIEWLRSGDCYISAKSDTAQVNEVQRLGTTGTKLLKA